MTTSRIKLLLAICLLLASNPARTEDLFSLGARAFEDGLYAEAATHWRQMADDNHGPSQFNLAILHEQGLGVSQDYSEALRLYTLAARNGILDAQFSLANILFIGTEHVDKDIDQAIYWYVQAADAGHTDAQFRLGYEFVNGDSMPPDMETGISWLELAAKNHHLEAESLLRRLADEQTGSVPGPAWLLSQDPEFFTVELYSAPTVALAHEYVLALELDNAAVYSSSPDRHHVVAGQFPSQQQAEGAVAALPVALRARMPRVRQFAAIHQQLSSAGAATGVAENLETPPALSDSANTSAGQLTEAVTVNDEQWIKARNPDRYTAVLFSSADQSQAISFANKAGLQGGAIYQAMDGRFRVLGGLFETLEEAIDAISRLPKELQALTPQPIKFSSIFLEMAEK